MVKSELTRFQRDLYYSSWQLFEEHNVCKIFDSAIYDITQIVLKEILYHEPEESNGKIFYTGWNYDNINKTAINSRNQSLYHPIYIQFDNEEGCARSWVDVRLIDGKTKEELKHDSIIIHINRFLVKKNDFIYQHFEYAFDINGTVPGLLAHEFTHVYDMWSSEFENIAYTLKNMSHSAFKEDLRLTREEYGHNYMNRDEVDLMEAMFGLMSKYECDGRLDAIDKAMSAVPANKIAEIISKYSDEDDKVTECIEQFDYIFGSGVRIFKIGMEMLNWHPNTFTKNNIRFQFEFMCFMIHYQFIEDPDDIITGAESMELLYNPEFVLDEHIKKLLYESSKAYEKCLNEYISDLKNVIGECLKRRRKKSPLEFKIYESISIDDKISWKCCYYPNDMNDVVYDILYKDLFENSRPAIKIAYELSNLLNCSIMQGRRKIKRAINEGLKEKPKIWVIDTAHFPV